jgi:hypothetical protein
MKVESRREREVHDAFLGGGLKGSKEEVPRRARPAAVHGCRCRGVQAKGQ